MKQASRLASSGAAEADVLPRHGDIGDMASSTDRAGGVFSRSICGNVAQYNHDGFERDLDVTRSAPFIPSDLPTGHFYRPGGRL